MKNILENEDPGMEVKTEAPMFEVKTEESHEYTNAWLAAKVKTTLLSHRNVNAYSIEVFATKKGKVTLRGKATSRAQKDLATEYAKDVDGVKDVENEMVVEDAAMTTDEITMSETVDAVSQLIDDSSITVMVKTKLLYNRSTSAINTIVETEEGVVNLSGIARNAAEKDLAAKLASDVHGVKRVINNIIVEVTELQKVA